ncbi:soluble quino protein glucose dehydrogenase [Aaosphaeria arxii CBS 175.79]|uniref:Soluble quino protein glucose dehydrogenase n=1 Tax=Aaosphaeria arxii CBS 175.79 TaxID=1450172 RepID=A0A6A5Y2Q3_9PLEO|nr:soluble quino protein glucose dehydrogenase [Aaosphaeria arxii CBS 175.79]KAF2019529.1 soluble quino protein glucose dehydrogenase [Aaosphaeria arxii CBS 175.79]
MVVLYGFVVIFASLTPTILGQKCATINPAYAPTWGSGFSGRVVMNGLKTPRGLVFDSENNLLVVESGGAGVRYIKLTDNGGNDVCVASSKQLIDEKGLNHGIDLSADGKTLFVSSMTTVFSYSYDAAAGTVGARKTLITGMSNSGHSTRTVLTSKKSPDLLIVSVGSNSNIDAATSQQSSGRSQLRIFSIAKVSQASVAYTSGEVLAWGLRNSVGVTENPVSGGIWSVENSVDDMKKNNVDIHNTNPCEELNYHGTLSGTSSERGANYGYPECFAAWDPSVIPNNQNIKVGTQFAIGSGNDATCAQRVAPKLCFPSHTAPLSVGFNRNSTAAYITFHGSWNRQPPDGYRLSKVSIDPATGMPTEPSTSSTAAINVMSNPSNGNCPSKCFRPVDLAFDAKGRLFMTSDSSNEVWVIGGT